MAKNTANPVSKRYSAYSVYKSLQKMSEDQLGAVGAHINDSYTDDAFSSTVKRDNAPTSSKRSVTSLKGASFKEKQRHSSDKSTTSNESQRSTGNKLKKLKRRLSFIEMGSKKRPLSSKQQAKMASNIQSGGSGTKSVNGKSLVHSKRCLSTNDVELMEQSGHFTRWELDSINLTPCSKSKDNGRTGEINDAAEGERCKSLQKMREKRKSPGEKVKKLTSNDSVATNRKSSTLTPDMKNLECNSSLDSIGKSASKKSRHSVTNRTGGNVETSAKLKKTSAGTSKARKKLNNDRVFNGKQGTKGKRKKHPVTLSTKIPAPTEDSDDSDLDTTLTHPASDVSDDDDDDPSALPLPHLPHPTTQPGGIQDSRVAGREAFKWLVAPVKLEKFEKLVWEKKPLLIKRNEKDYFRGLFSTGELDHILRNEDVEFSVNIDVTSYTDGKRETHNPDGRAYAALVWDYYQQGCSVRMLNPQSYSNSVWQLCSTLQEYFGSFVGANVYLTPPGTQGFAPHYDDIEAFICQLEGSKRWRLYQGAEGEGDALPRYSSANLSQGELGPPVLDVTLSAGDVLYMPRGLVHQGETSDSDHSLHITVSTYQRNTWGDLLAKLLPAALEVAMENDIEFRRGLPMDYLYQAGFSYQSEEGSVSDGGRSSNELTNHIRRLMGKLVQYAPIDGAVDEYSKRYMHEALPPCLTPEELSLSVHDGGEYWDSDEGQVCGIQEITPQTQIRIIRRGCVRLVMSGDASQPVVYHCLTNSRVYQQREVQCLEVSESTAACLDYLIQAYPDFVTVDTLPNQRDDDTSEGEGEEDGIQRDPLQEMLDAANLLYDKGLIMIREQPEPLAY